MRQAVGILVPKDRISAIAAAPELIKARTVSVLDIKTFWKSCEVDCYAYCSVHGVPRRATAFSCSNILRITATRATLPTLPRSRRRR